MMLSSSRARMMQPPFQMRAISFSEMFQLYLSLPARISCSPWAYEQIFEASSASCTACDQRRPCRRRSGARPGHAADLLARRPPARPSCSTARAPSSAAAMVGMGTPRSSAISAVHLPVPFWPALSWTRSTSGLPVSLVLHLQHLGRSARSGTRPAAPGSSWVKISPISGADSPSAARRAGRRPRRSAACRRIRCRCGPSSRSGPRRRDRRGSRTGPSRSWRRSPRGSAAATPRPPSSPPGISEGPRRAPSSPPDTPMPTKLMPSCLQVGLAPARLLEVGVAAVDDDVARLQQRLQLVQHLVDRLARLDHHPHAARPLQHRHQLRPATWSPTNLLGCRCRRRTCR